MPSANNYRLYGFVPYQLSPIQAGIQFGHAAVELMTKYPPADAAPPSEPYDSFADAVYDWSRHDKTFVILNGGPMTNLNTLLQEFIVQFGSTHPHAIFCEPDLNNGLSAFVFLVPESEWGYYDSEKWTYLPIGYPMPAIPPMRLFLDKFNLYR